MTSSLVGSHCFIEIHPLSLKGQYSPQCGIMTMTQRPKTIHWNTPHLTKVQLLTPVPSPFVNNPLPHFLCSRLGLKHTSPCDWKHNSFTKRILNIFCMQFLLSGNHKALMPNCSQFSSQRLVAGRILKQLVWWFWVALDSIMQQSALLMVSPICFYSSPVQENLYSFIHSRVKPWIKSPVRLTWQLFYSPEMNTDHIPVLHHTLFSLHVRMQSFARWMLLWMWQESWQSL